MTGSYATVGSLQARVTERPDGYRVHILQEFVDCSGPRLLLDYSGCPLPFDRVQPSVGEVRNLYDSTGRPEFEIVLDRSSPERLMLRYELDWRPRSNLQLPWIVLPDCAPRPAAARKHRQPRITVDAPAHLERLTLSADDSSAATQLGLVDLTAWDIERSATWSLIAPKQRAYELRHVADVLEVAEDIHTTLGHLFGVAPSIHGAIAAVSDSSPALDTSGVTHSVSPDFLGLESGDHIMLLASGTALLAASWWGVGIRVDGAEGTVLCHALCFWSGVQYARMTDRKALETYWMRRLSMMSDAKASSGPERDQQRAARLTSILLDRENSGTDVVGAVRDVTKSNWGFVVPFADILAEFGARRLLSAGTQ